MRIACAITFKNRLSVGTRSTTAVTEAVTGPHRVPEVSPQDGPQ